MLPAIPCQLYRSARPGYDRGGNIPVGMKQVQDWIEKAQALDIKSIICLLAEEHLRLYPDPGLIQIYREAGFTVRHIPVNDHHHPPLAPDQLAAVLSAYRDLPKPVLIHCSAGVDRTGAAVAYILEHEGRNVS